MGKKRINPERPLTNAEKQQRWREKRKQEVEDLKAKIRLLNLKLEGEEVLREEQWRYIHTLEAEIEKLKGEIA